MNWVRRWWNWRSSLILVQSILPLEPASRDPSKTRKLISIHDGCSIRFHLRPSSIVNSRESQGIWHVRSFGRSSAIRQGKNSPSWISGHYPFSKITFSVILKQRAQSWTQTEYGCGSSWFALRISSRDLRFGRMLNSSRPTAEPISREGSVTNGPVPSLAALIDLVHRLPPVISEISKRAMRLRKLLAISGSVFEHCYRYFPRLIRGSQLLTMRMISNVCVPRSRPQWLPL